MKKLKRKEIIEELIKEIGYKCWYCGVDVDESVHVDHIIAKSQGGSDKMDNFALACKICNTHKFYFPVERFLKYLARIRTGNFNCYITKRYEFEEMEDVELDILSKGFKS